LEATFLHNLQQFCVLHFKGSVAMYSRYQWKYCKSFIGISFSD